MYFIALNFVFTAHDAVNAAEIQSDSVARSPKLLSIKIIVHSRVGIFVEILCIILHYSGC